MEGGYHMSHIPKGVLGDLSKIEEELAELKDAVQQNSTIMALIELSDLYGSIDHYLRKNHPGVTMDDLKAFSDITERAFKVGQR